ncbi:hypothetical protein NP493_213g03031 [Ridgeia piscesae]|uniref:Uncharacterized protein n=1 Tax=Ridgeia piscesae TaxID=27915 RepID=A0AAD9UE78_RIDPI|nr:hypothetical protein NP493_213g03031 [Ridgeia piscesae]
MTLGTPFHPTVMMVHNAIHASDLAMINTPNLGKTFQWNVQNMANDAMTLEMVSRHHIGRVTEMSPSTSSMASPVNGITGSTSSSSLPEAYNWDPDEKMTRLVSCLRGPALTAHRSLPREGRYDYDGCIEYLVMSVESILTKQHSEETTLVAQVVQGVVRQLQQSTVSLETALSISPELFRMRRQGTEVHFLGRKVSHEGVSITNGHVKSILNWPRPKNALQSTNATKNFTTGDLVSMKGEGTVPWRRDTTCIYDCRDGPLEKGGKCSLGCDNVLFRKKGWYPKKGSRSNMGMRATLSEVAKMMGRPIAAVDIQLCPPNHPVSLLNWDSMGRMLAEMPPNKQDSFREWLVPSMLPQPVHTVETDAPLLSPQGHNYGNPYEVVHQACYIASLRNLPSWVVLHVANLNSRAFYKV